uniref:Uncharacterized protein n=1 Tax=Ignisphaera aggregans TaxID=334771 RepID=A0A7C2VLT4_9CREN
MASYANTVKTLFRDQLAILTIRGICGIISAVFLYIFFSVNDYGLVLLRTIFNDYYSYFTWVYLFVFYPLSIVAVKLLVNVEKKFDLVLRGITIYFALGVITYSILSIA